MYVIFERNSSHTFLIISGSHNKVHVTQDPPLVREAWPKWYPKDVYVETLLVYKLYYLWPNWFLNSWKLHLDQGGKRKHERKKLDDLIVRNYWIIYLLNYFFFFAKSFNQTQPNPLEHSFLVILLLFFLYNFIFFVVIILP